MAEFDQNRGRDGADTSADVVTGGSAGKQTLVQRRYGAIQRKADGGQESGGGAGGGGSGAPMPAAVESKMSQSFGIDFSGVRIHEGGDAAAMGAQAFTRGQDIHFAPGRYQPDSAAGQELLGHELTHVAQQAQGRVSATSQAKGLAVNDDAGLEREADELGARAARGERADVGQAVLRGDSGPAQLKREPISSQGESFLAYLKNHFRTMKRDSLKQTRKNESVEYTKQLALAIDVSKEKNEDFIALVKIFKTGLHGSDVEKIREGVESKFTALGIELQAEAGEQVTAENQEAAEGGHAIGRHGPEVSDEALQRRLFTGIAPDDELVPAPGASSRFNSYTDMNACRQAAAAALRLELATAQAHVVNWLATVPGLATAHANAQLDVTAKTNALTTALGEKTTAFAKGSTAPQTEKDLKLANFKNAQTDKKNAETAEKTAKDEMDNPGKNLKKALPGLTKVKFDIQDDAGAAPNELKDTVKLSESQGITVDLGRSIGSGFAASDTDAIRLKDVLPQVCVDVNVSPPQPKSKTDISSALGTLGVTQHVSEYTDWLSDPANLESVKKKGDKGGKIYKTVTTAGALQKSYTNFRRAGDGTAFDGADAPLVLDPTAWDAIQHFPAPPGAPVGMD